MQVVVKKPHIRMEGEISKEFISYLQEKYGEIEINEDEEDKLVEITRSDWYRNIRNQITPGENLRFYRHLHKLTQKELGEKLGNFTRQNISNMERGSRSISKAAAKKLAEIFNVSLEKFL